MSRSQGKIVLCKSFSTESDTVDIYKNTFESAGYNFEYLPTICFTFVNQSDLEECLFRPNSFSGIILTSPRSVEAVKLILKKTPSILEQWKELPAYCVGPSSEDLAKKCLHLSNCLGSHCGNAENLAKLISTNSCCKDKPMLYPCSEISRDTIESHLIQNGYKVKKIISYKTMPCRDLKENSERIFELIPQVVIFFSPSVVENLLLVLGKKVTILNQAKVVAIGSVTGEALTNAGILVDAISDKPTPEALLNAVVQSMKVMKL